LCKVKLGLCADTIGTLPEEDVLIQEKFKRRNKASALARVVFRASI